MFIGFKVHTRAVPVVISNGLRAAISLECLRHTGRRSVLHAYSYIQQSGRNLKSMTAKNTKKITDSRECGREHNLRVW